MRTGTLTKTKHGTRIPWRYFPANGVKLLPQWTTDMEAENQSAYLRRPEPAWLQSSPISCLSDFWKVTEAKEPCEKGWTGWRRDLQKRLQGGLWLRCGNLGFRSNLFLSHAPQYDSVLPVCYAVWINWALVFLLGGWSKRGCLWLTHKFLTFNPESPIHIIGYSWRKWMHWVVLSRERGNIRKSMGFSRCNPFPGHSVVWPYYYSLRYLLL